MNPIGDKDKLWRAARVVLAAHGAEAAAVAEKRSTDLVRQGEADVATAWKQVAAAVRALSRWNAA